MGKDVLSLQEILKNINKDQGATVVDFGMKDLSV